MKFHETLAVILCPLLFLTSCEEDNRRAEVDQFAMELGAKRIADLAQRLEVFRARSMKLDRGLASLKKQEARWNGVEGRLASLVSEKETLQGEIEGEKLAKLAYVDHAREQNRLAARGEKMDRLEVASGRVYIDLKITKVTDVGLEIRHSQGSARVAFNDLSEDLQNRFLYDSEIASDVMRGERVRAARYASLMDVAIAKKRVEDAALAEKRAERDSEERIARLQRASSIASSRVSASRIESSGSRLGGSTSNNFRVYTRRTSRYNRYNRYYRSRPTYYYYNPRPTYPVCPPSRPRLPRTRSVPASN